VIDLNTVTVSPKFQVVIPLAVRERMKLLPGTKLMVIEFNGGLRLMPQCPAAELRGKGVPVDLPLALAAALNRLPMADSLIYATARAHGAELWTQGGHFEGLAGVRFLGKG